MVMGQLRQKSSDSLPGLAENRRAQEKEATGPQSKALAVPASSWGHTPCTQQWHQGVCCLRVAAKGCPALGHTSPSAVTSAPSWPWHSQSSCPQAPPATLPRSQDTPLKNPRGTADTPTLQMPGASHTPPHSPPRSPLAGLRFRGTCNVSQEWHHRLQGSLGFSCKC